MFEQHILVTYPPASAIAAGGVASSIFPLRAWSKQVRNVVSLVENKLPPRSARKLKPQPVRGEDKRRGECIRYLEKLKFWRMHSEPTEEAARSLDYGREPIRGVVTAVHQTEKYASTARN